MSLASALKGFLRQTPKQLETNTVHLRKRDDFKQDKRNLSRFTDQ